MIAGRYGDTSKRPYVEGRVSIIDPKINSNISFVFDTGADRTVIMPEDAVKMGIDFGKLNRKTSLRGVGGLHDARLVDALVTFRDADTTLYIYKIELTVAVPTAETMIVGSLLGRDIINCWRVDYHPVGDFVGFMPQTAMQIIGPNSAKVQLPPRKLGMP